METTIIQVNKWPHDVPPTEAKLRQLLQNENLEPYLWSNGANDVYTAHEHTYHKVIYVVSGTITFGFPIDGDPTTLYAGDRLELPAHIQHNAVVGIDGVVCLEAHRGMKDEG